MKNIVGFTLLIFLGFASCKGSKNGTDNTDSNEVVEHENLSQDQEKMDSIKRIKNRNK